MTEFPQRFWAGKHLNGVRAARNQLCPIFFYQLSGARVMAGVDRLARFI
jgi:hypothetical protein